MKALFQGVAIAVLVVAGQAAAAAVDEVDWADLPDPSVQVFEDPFRDLNAEQFDDFLFVIRLRNRLQQDVGTPEERQKWQDLLTATEEALATDGIDIDWLLDQRQPVTERRNKARARGNPALDGQTVTIAGFAIPAPTAADGQAIAYLVPQFGMCSHFPPPPPNQMILVRLTGDWQPERFHEPVQLTGVLTIDPTAHEIDLIDGLVPMRATFQLESAQVELLENGDDRLDWSLGLFNHLGSAGTRKTGGGAAGN